MLPTSPESIQSFRRHLPGHGLFFSLTVLCCLLAPCTSAPGAQTMSLAWSTYLGGQAQDMGWSMTMAPDGSVLLVGETYSPDFPATVGAFDTTYADISEGHFLRLSAAGSDLLQASYLGAKNRDVCRDVRLDDLGNIYIVGATNSPDFPVTLDAAFPHLAGWAHDAFLAKFDPSGIEMLYGSYLGGSGNDKGRSLTLLGSDLVCVTGYTSSGDFPTTPDAFDLSWGGDWDVFLTCFDLRTGQIIYSTYVGDTGQEEPWDIVGDDAGCVYVAGYTYSAQFPATANALDRSWNGDADGFVFKLDILAGALHWSTFLGGSGADHVERLCLSNEHGVYLVGGTSSTDFPVDPGAFDITHNGGEDSFVAALSADGSALLGGSFLGGVANERASAIGLTADGYICVAGNTYSDDFPLAGDPPYPHRAGNADLFCAVLDGRLETLLVSTYLGGEGWENVKNLGFSDPRSLVLVGLTESQHFLTTPAAFDTSFNGETDAFALGLDFMPDAAGVSPVGPQAGTTLSVTPLLSAGGLRVRLHLPAAGVVRLDLFDAEGRHTTRLCDGWLERGDHELSGSPDPVLPGPGSQPAIVFVRLAASGAVTTHQALRIR